MARALLLVALLSAAAVSPQLVRGGGAGAGSPAVVLESRFAPSPLRACRPATWRFRVVNRSGRAGQLRFRSGQRGEVPLSRGRGDELVYRWSEMRAFTLALWQRTLTRGGVWSFELKDKLRAPAGRYLMTMRVTASATLSARLVTRRWVIVRGSKECESNVAGSRAPAAARVP